MQIINQVFFKGIGLCVFLFLSFRMLCISQTDVQNRKIYEGVQGLVEGENIVSLIDPGLGEVDSLTFFNESTILPVFKYNHENKGWIKNLSLFIIIFKDVLFTYNEYPGSNRSPTSFKFNTLETTSSIEFIHKHRNSLRIGYLFDSYYKKISRDDLFYIDIEDGTVFYNGAELSSIDELIVNNFGSMGKYKELASLDNERSKLSVEDIDEAIKNNYWNYIQKYNRDTLLVVNVLISQISSAIGWELEKNRSEILKERILKRLYPLKYRSADFVEIVQEEYYKQLNEAQKKYYGQLKKKKIEKLNDNSMNYYDFMIYDIDITNDIVFVLTKEEIIKYMRYKELYYPYSKFHKSRFIYGRRILEKKEIIEVNNDQDFSNYIQKIINTKGYKCTD